MGTGGDLEIYHDGSDSYIRDLGTGELRISGSKTRIYDADLSSLQAEFIDGGSVDLYYDSNKKFATTIDGIQLYGNGYLDMPDNGRIRMGASYDLAIYHDASHSYIDEVGTGDLRIRSNSATALLSSTNENMLVAIANGAVELYYDNSKKFETTSTGVDITGHLSATTKSFLVDNPKTGGKLQYGVVESDEHGVYVRGKSDQEVVELPEEWDWLVHEDSVTVQLTSVGQMQQLFVVEQNNKRIKVSGLAPNGQYNYVVYGTRKDVDALEKHLK